jgi:hypothetical protein
VLTHVFWIIAAAGVLAALCYCLEAGLRDGDRPGDAQVTALLSTGTQPDTVPPDRASPVIVVTVRNPAGTPVLVALSARRALLPAPLTEPRGVSVPWLRGRGKFLPGKFETVGVAPAGGAAELAVPVTARARRYVLTAAVGQEGSRLRVHRLRVGPVSCQGEGQDEFISSATLR